jgi:hypothetical protein
LIYKVFTQNFLLLYRNTPYIVPATNLKFFFHF